MKRYKKLIDGLKRTHIPLRDITDRAVVAGVSKGQVMADIQDVKDINTPDIMLAYDESCLDTSIFEEVSVHGVYTLKDIHKDILEMKKNPQIDTGDSLGWLNVKLTLKPEIYVITGIPSSGKSAWCDNVIINSMLMHKYKWAIFSPENLPISIHAKTLIEIATRTNFYGKYNVQTTSDDLVNQFINKFNEGLFFIDPIDDNALKIENILELIKYQIEYNDVNAFILDPYNEFSHTRDKGISETEYVSHFLQKVRRFVKRYNVMCFLVAHPTKLQKQPDGTYPIPTAYDIAGSANFYNKADNIISVHRDKSRESNPDNKVEIVVQKVRFKGTGEIGKYQLQYDYPTGTYKDVPRIDDSDIPNYDNQVK